MNTQLPKANSPIYPHSIHSKFLAAFLSCVGLTAIGTPLELGFTVPSSFNESNRQAVLQWNAEPARTYLVQSTDDLSADWETKEAVRTTSAGPVRWMAPEALSERRYYRLILPQTELFSVEPAFLSSEDPNALLYLTGQMLPEDCTVVINGQTFTPTQFAGDASWVGLSLKGLLPGTSIAGTILLLDGSSNVVATLPVQGPVVYGTSLSDEQLQGPPEDPPAAADTFIVEELEFAVEKVERARIANYGHVTVLKAYATDSYVETTQRAYSKKGYDHYQALASVSLGSGEFQSQSTDLVVPGRGLSFAWTRTYRSRTGPTTAMGAGWDFSYNVSLTQQPDGTIVLRPGNGRSDTFYPDGTNGWTRDEYFLEIRDLNGDGMPDVLFADTGKWLFKPQGSPEAGKLWQIVDRNGNTMTLSYDPSGRLASIVDTLNRTNTVSYNPVGQIESVTDFSGRVVRYEYDGAGDLTACISPSVTGTPNGNDYPGGKTNRFTYTSGQPDARLNHNLASIIDGKGQTILEVIYQKTIDPASIDFDAVSSVLRGIDKKDIRRGMVIAKPGSYATVQAIVNDFVGNVTEYLFDSRQRCVSMREFTGRANPSLPTTALENRPKGKLRSEDPDFFETRWEWNADSLCTLEIRPNGDSTEISHQRAQDHNSSRSNKTASRRHDGDVRVLRERAGSAVDTDGDGAPDTSELTWHFAYDPRFGSPARCYGKKLYVGNLPFSAAERKGRDGTTKGASYDSAKIITDRDTGRSKGFGFVTQEIDPRGNYTINQYDSSGNCTKSIKQGHYAVSNFKIEVDAAYNGHGQITIITNAPDANGYRRVDTISYYPSGPQMSMVEVMMASAMAGGLALATAFEHDVRGNVTQVTDPRGNTTLFAYNALDQCVQFQTASYGGGGGLPAQRVTCQYFYDSNDNVVRCDMENRDETGALSGSNPQWTTLYEYDSRDRLIEEIREIAEGGGLPSLHATNRYVYDGNDNLTEVRSPLAVSGADPDNTISLEYDERGLLFRQIAAPGSPSQSTTQYDYDGNSNLIRASEGLEEEPSVTTFQYEKLKHRGGGGKAQGVMGAKAKAWMVNNYEVHPVFGLRKSDSDPKLEGGKEGLAVVETVWNKQCLEKDTTVRLSRITDPLGNATTYHYDANSNLKVVRHFGETTDLPGDAGNVLLAETRCTYDSFDRCVQQADSFFDILTGGPIGDGKAITTYSYAPNGACVSVSDDNGHTMRFTYDTAGRRSLLADPKGSVVQYTYDACDNLLSKTSNERSDLAQGSQQFSVTYTYDALNRCVTTVDNVGNTNRYSYDSRHNVISHLDPRENESVSVFDGLNRCVTSINYVGKDRGITINTSHVEYDVNSRVTASSDSNGNTTTYAYDELNRCVAVTEADGTVCSLVWSPRSNLLRVEDANGTTITNTFDLLNRIVHRDIAARGEALATTTFEMFAYDGLSRCVAASNDVSLVTFGYDSLAHCVRTSQDGLSSTATFDGADNRLALTYPSGRIVTSGYDGLNQITNLSSSAAGGLPSVTLATFGYDGPGRLGRLIRGNNVATRYQWNGLANPKNTPGDFGWQQISVINHQIAGAGAIVDRRASTFDPSQNRLLQAQIAPFYPGGPMRTNQFVYDALNRLAGKSDSILGLIRIYELDGNGNRVTVSSNGVPQSYTMDNTFPDPADFQMNQYTVTPFGSLAYDANGNLMSRLTPEGPVFFQYDYANRLVLVGALSAEGTLQPVATFAYDALGRRISKTTYPPSPLAPVTMQYVHGGGDCDDTAEILEVRSGGVVLATHAGSGAAAASYAATGRTAPPLVTFNTSGEPMFLHADEMGNVLALTDAAGSVLERYDYDEFGQPTFLTSDGQPLPSGESAFGNVFLFHGMEWDAETGLYYNHAGQGARNSNPLFESSGNSGENPLFEGHYVDCQTATTIGLPKITPKIAKESHGKRFAGNNAWSPRASKGTVKFFNESKGFRRGGGGAGGIVVVLDGIDGTAKLIVPIAMDKGLRFAAREEGGRHTPFHNKYRPQFRKILDYGEAGDNVSVLARTKCRCTKCVGGYVGHITLLK